MVTWLALRSITMTRPRQRSRPLGRPSPTYTSTIQTLGPGVKGRQRRMSPWTLAGVDRRPLTKKENPMPETTTENIELEIRAYSAEEGAAYGMVYIPGDGPDEGDYYGDTRRVVWSIYGRVLHVHVGNWGDVSPAGFATALELLAGNGELAPLYDSVETDGFGGEDVPNTAAYEDAGTAAQAIAAHNARFYALPDEDQVALLDLAAALLDAEEALMCLDDGRGLVNAMRTLMTVTPL